MKKVDRSAHIGDSGIALIHRRVNQMGFVWHERQTDAGIDGEIEFRDPATGAVANRVLFVQSKASDNPFPGETDRSFHFQCRHRDIDYWLSADVPVLLVCSHPEADQAWWADLKAWFADPAHRASGRIDFDKATQRFDAEAAHRLLNLSDPHGYAHSPAPLDAPEVLISNLLQVGVPQALFSAPTDVQRAGEVFARMRDSGEPVRHDWVLREGRLFTWLPPQETALKAVAVGLPDVVPVAEWADSPDPSRQRSLVQLLNQAFRQDTSKDCDWSKDRRYIYFQATPSLKPRKILSATGRARLVFNPKQKKDGSGLSYCQHAALNWQFVPVDGEWFCELTPTWHYTRDGYRESGYADKYLSGIKRMEKNAAVLGATRMWAAYLHGEDNLIDQRDSLLDYGDLLTFEVNQGINDAVWSHDPRAPSALDADDADDWALFEAMP